MSSFISRVELHNASYQHYELLHTQMKLRGFSRQIRGDDGNLYQLPPAEYHFAGTLTRDQVTEAAKQSAAAVRPSFAVLVSEYTAASWYGLPLAA